MNRSTLTMLLFLALVAACKRGGDADVKHDPPPPPAVTAIASAAPAASSAAGPIASGAPTFAAALPPARLAEAPIALHVVAEETREIAEGQPYWTQLPSDVPRPLRIHALRDRMLVTSSDTAVYGLEDGKLKLDEEIPTQMLLTAGYDPGSLHQASDVFVTAIVGRWPTDAWVTAYGMYTDGARLSNVAEETYTRQGGRFVRSPRPGAAVAWSRGRTLLLRGEDLSTTRPGGGEAPKRALGADGLARIKAEALTALPSGELLLLGRDRDQDLRLSIERWAPDHPESTIVLLPSPEAKLTRAWVLGTERDRYALASYEKATFLARVDVTEGGATATQLPLPSTRPITGAALADDGALWIHFGQGATEELYRRDADGSYARASFPAREALDPEGMYAASDGTFYLAGSTSPARSVILSTRDGKLFETPPAHASAVPTAAASASGAAVDAGPGAPGALGGSCATPFVLLFGVSKTAPDDYDYPATRDALSGWADRAKYHFLEYTLRGQRRLGASAPDAAAADALVARIHERVKGSSPSAACFKPTEVLREVKLGG